MEKSNVVNNTDPDLPPSYDQSQLSGNGNAVADATSDDLGQRHLPQQPPPQQVVVQQVLTPRPQLGKHGVQVQCPNCRSTVLTRTEKDPSDKAWLFGGLIFLLGGLCLSFIPCFMNSMQDTKHICPSCRYIIGIHKA